MFRKKGFFMFLLVSLAFLLVVGCSAEETQQEEVVEEQQEETTEDATVSEDEEGLTITTSFSILGDIIGNVVGDRGSVEYIVPIGEEPHEYEPVPSDFRKVSDSDVFYVNGLGLEEWLGKLVESVGDVTIVSVSDGITPIMLEGDEEEDPHAWMSVANVKVYVENIVEDLIERDPEGESTYRENADAYLEELEELDAFITSEIEGIPEENRVIVVSEDAFKYFGEAYGFQTEGVWEINSHEEGTPGQIARVIDVVNDQNIPAIFVETTVDRRYMESVSGDTGVEIAGEVYTDAVGQEGSGAETYVLMMKHNVETFVNGLK
ncbi:metal ABC transporter substrate-binding protein [Alkalihalobacillus sp. MEB130]|uniref:metal ABC transporter substrate-binding protein n=1 Tax=Alkalihalobacillus sp. MEB130 TaxID=2976704 RepID=UPI0028DE55B6|nr:metal ABC transporter substrate-binding protein [Alkalihalobacillus sp. MEB130]MDT8859304.1 metal ABC transporter substrate-binding protein [Alkalihalobacillus sp. MEB130]